MSLATSLLVHTLREGDRLTAEEFLRRWEKMPDLKHAELINGIVFFNPSPVSTAHSDSHFDLAQWLGTYRDATPGCQAGLECTWRMGPDDVAQPDLFLRLDPEYGGQSRTEGKYAAGAPELTVEVSGSSTSRDLGVKLALYRRSGVREYLSVLLNPKQVIWRTLVRGDMRKSRRKIADCIALAFSLVCGWIRRRCGVLAGRCERQSKEVSNPSSMRLLCGSWRHGRRGSGRGSLNSKVMRWALSSAG